MRFRVYLQILYVLVTNENLVEHISPTSGQCTVSFFVVRFLSRPQGREERLASVARQSGGASQNDSHRNSKRNRIRDGKKASK